MKLVGLVLASLGIKNARAGGSDILGGLQQLEEVANNKSISETGDRAFQGFIADFFADIDHYACWCYFDEDYVLGKGPVQDSVDAECKRLINGYHCAVIDGIARATPCSPHEIVYIPYNFFSATTALEIECATSNSGNADPACATDACIIEGAFTLAFFSQFFQPGGITFDASLSHPESPNNPGTFDPSVECAGPGGGQASEKQCCGAAPGRFPFKTFEGERACCGGRTYGTSTLQCCVDPATSVETVLDVGDSCPA